MSRNAGRIAAEAGLSNPAIAMGVSLFGGCVDFDSEARLGITNWSANAFITRSLGKQAEFVLVAGEAIRISCTNSAAP